MRAFVLSFALLFAGAATAVPVTWTVNATFYDGGTLTGTFVFDADGNHYDEVNLFASAGAIDDRSWSLTHFNEVNPEYDDSALAISFLAVPDPLALAEWSMVLGFDTALTDAGGTVNLLPGYLDATTGSAMGVPSYEFLSLPLPSAGNFRHIVSGTLTAAAVPIPAAAWLFASGLGLLGWARRR